jgi:hypothetical protein
LTWRDRPSGTQTAWWLALAGGERRTSCPTYETSILLPRQRSLQQPQVVRTRAERLAPARDILDVSGDTVVVPGRLVNEAVGDADKLVGPDSTSADPLIRSSLARMIVHRYIAAVIASQRVDLTERAVWNHDQSRLSVRWSGSFFGPVDPDASPG